MFIDKVQVFQSDTASRNPSVVMHLAKTNTQHKEKRQTGGYEETEVVKVVEVRSLRAKL